MNVTHSAAIRVVCGIFERGCPKCRESLGKCGECGRGRAKEDVSPWSITCGYCGFLVHELDLCELSDGAALPGDVEKLVAKCLEAQARVQPEAKHDRPNPHRRPVEARAMEIVNREFFSPACPLCRGSLEPVTCGECRRDRKVVKHDPLAYVHCQLCGAGVHEMHFYPLPDDATDDDVRALIHKMETNRREYDEALRESLRTPENRARTAAVFALV